MLLIVLRGGGMMIEYMSTIILTGCGPEVCMTSNNARHCLKHQAEQEARGEERRKQVMETAWALERKKGAKKETQVNRNYSLPPPHAPQTQTHTQTHTLNKSTQAPS